MTNRPFTLFEFSQTKVTLLKIMLTLSYSLLLLDVTNKLLSTIVSDTAATKIIRHDNRATQEERPT